LTLIRELPSLLVAQLLPAGYAGMTSVLTAGRASQPGSVAQLSNGSSRSRTAALKPASAARRWNA